MNGKPYISAIVPAAGSGVRMGAKVSKPLVELGGVPLIVHTLKSLSVNPYIRDIVLVTNLSCAAALEKIVRARRFKKVRKIVLGGSTRRASVENGLKAVAERADYVLIHDAVRPFAGQDLINRVIEAAIQSGAAIPGAKVKGTIKRARNFSVPLTRENLTIVAETLKRENLFEIQTPQVFKKSLIIRAYQADPDAFATDDASLVERLGVKVRIVDGSYSNIKITTPEDMLFARAIMAVSRRNKT